MSAPTRASPRKASVQARRSSSLGRKESFDLANRQLRTSPKQDARSSVPSDCFRTLAPSKGDVFKPSASSLNRAKMRASRAASSSCTTTRAAAARRARAGAFGTVVAGARRGRVPVAGALLRRCARGAAGRAPQGARGGEHEAGVNGAIVSSARASASFCVRALLPASGAASLHLSLAPGAPPSESRQTRQFRRRVSYV